MITDQTVMEAKRLGVFSCHEDCPLSKAAQHMVDEDISALVVEDSDGFLRGIVTRTDMLRAVVTSDDWGVHTVKDFMSPDVITVGPETSLIQVASILLNEQIHRVVVARDEGGKLRPLSVVSAADVIYHMVNS